MERLIFYSLAEAELFDAKLIDRGLANIASRGFDSVYLEYRNLRAGILTPRSRRAIAYFCRRAAKYKLRVVVSSHYWQLMPQMIEQSPEIFTDTWQPVRAKLRHGQFDIALPGEVLHRHVERCWLLQNGRARDVTKRLQVMQTKTEGGGCAMTEAKGASIPHTTYRIDGAQTGDVFLVVRRRYEYSYLDLGHPKLRRYVDEMLKLFRKLPVDGYAWDEPHFGFAFWPDDGRSISDRLLRTFRQRFGYSLQARLFDLWHDQPDGRSPQTRLDYAELLESALAGLEKYFVRRAPKGKFFGIHRTMHEEMSDDFLIGCADYFRHNRYTSDGFTDSVFEREDSMVAMLHLARSLAAENGGAAYNNSWGFRPTEAHHDYYLSLMAAMNIRWIAHTYHSSHLFGPGYPDHPLWQTLPRHLAEHKRALAVLRDAVPVADTAVVYDWRSLAAYPGNYFHVHRRNLLLLAKALTYSHVQFRFVPRADVRGYSRVIIPWPDRLPAAAPKTELLLFGLPRGSLAHWCRTTFKVRDGDVLEFAGKRFPLAPDKIEPHYRSNPRYTYPDHFKAGVVRPPRGAEIIATIAGKPVAFRHQNVTYFACELPHFAGALEQLFPSANPQLALFHYRRGTERLLAGVSRWSRPFTGTVRWDDRELHLNRCRLFIARAQHGTKKLSGMRA